MDSMDSPSHVVREIVSTYDLSQRIRDKVIRAATNYSHDHRTFDEQYRYIAELVGAYAVPYQERKALRLDAPIRDKDSPRLFHEVIGEQAPERGAVYLTAQEALDSLECRVDGYVIRQLRELVSGQTIFIETTERDIAQNAQQIAGRLEEMAVEYEVNGRILFPPRKIVHIRFNPLAVRYGNRNYDGDSVSYYLSHLNVYRGLNQSQLAVFDYGMLKALYISGKLNDLIPPRGRRGRLSKAERCRVVDALKRSNGIVRRAVLETGHSAECVDYHGRMAGLVTKRPWKDHGPRPRRGNE